MSRKRINIYAVITLNTIIGPMRVTYLNQGKIISKFPFFNSFTVSRRHYLSLLSWLSAISTFRTTGVQHIRWEGNESSLRSRHSLNEFTRSTKHPKCILNKISMLVDYASRGRSVFVYNVTQCLLIISREILPLSHLKQQTHSSIG